MEGGRLLRGEGQVEGMAADGEAQSMRNAVLRSSRVPVGDLDVQVEVGFQDSLLVIVEQVDA